MSKTTVLQLPVHRVEGDLEIKVELRDGAVADAWSAGTMFRGFEGILKGRGALDGLVVTPRVCGICTTAHLTAACKALDAITGIPVPDSAVRLRNAALMTEHLQSDVRHSLLMFAADFAHPAHRGHSLFEEAVRRYRPFSGERGVEAMRETKSLLQIVAIIGGQWPHSSYMVPGGTVSAPDTKDLLQCRHLLRLYRGWYERTVLGCSIERWREVRDAAGLEAWLEESPSHRDGDVGFLIRFAREAGLDNLGRGPGHFLSYGSLEMPADTRAVPMGADPARFVPAGFARGIDVEPFDPEQIAEHIAHSWFQGYEGGRHPFDGVTDPYASGGEGEKYSWAKAPRYRGLPAETGPLAEMVVAGIPLFRGLVADRGPNVLTRQLARIGRPALLFAALDAWLSELSEGTGPFYRSPGEIVEGVGAGLVHASRGALGHWVKIEGGRIRHYQIVTPTAWHASPRDAAGVRGVFEEALVGTPVKDEKNPVEIGHVIRSFDPCLVCTVH
jgi:Ni,Fe-hydrogenase I large subunit